MTFDTINTKRFDNVQPCFVVLAESGFDQVTWPESGATSKKPTKMMKMTKHVVAMMLVLALAAMATVMAQEQVDDVETEVQTETKTKTVHQELLFGVITPQCFHAFVTDHDFFNISCLKMVISKLLGFAIITGSFVLKLPQILKIAAAKDATGLTPTSFYMEVVLFVSSTAYNVLRGYPISAWGENAVVLVQNIILVLLLWAYRTPKVPVQTRLLLVLAFFTLAGGMLLTPPKYQWILASMGIPVSIAARIPQV